MCKITGFKLYFDTVQALKALRYPSKLLKLLKT